MFSYLRTYHKDKLSFVSLMVLTIAMLMTTGNSSYAQNSEIGLEFGAYHYLGDVNRRFTPSTTKIGGQFFVRKHINDGVSFRFSVGGGSLEGIDNEAFDVFSANRTASFNASFVNADILMEYHFLQYRNERLEQFWSPYVFFGLGFYSLNGKSSIDGGVTSTSYNTGLNVRLPVGIGIKYRFNRRWILGISTSAIKTNSDLIDNVSAADLSIKNYRGGNPNDDDWMFHTAISISFTFHKIYCPEGWFK